MDVRAAYPANITVDTDLEGLPFGSQSGHAVWTQLNESTTQSSSRRRIVHLRAADDFPWLPATGEQAGRAKRRIRLHLNAGVKITHSQPPSPRIAVAYFMA